MAVLMVSNRTFTSLKSSGWPDSVDQNSSASAAAYAVLAAVGSQG